jgi:serine/threonine protein kinase
MTNITDEPIKECLETNNSIIQETARRRAVPAFTSNKMQYVGKQTFQKYFLSILLERSMKVKQSSYVYTATLSDKRMHRYLSSIVNAHLYLLQTLSLLNQNGILHLDIKENNVMHNKENDVFIMIDFGLSVFVSNLEPSVYAKTSKSPFAFLSEKYQPWCVDITLMAFIARRIIMSDTNRVVSEDKFNSKISNEDVQEMRRICTMYVANNRTFQTILFDDNDRKNYEMRLHTWVQGFKGKTMKDIWIRILATHPSWDHYGMTIMFFKELLNTGVIAFVLDHQKNTQTSGDKKVQAPTLTSVVSSFATPSLPVKIADVKKSDLLFLYDYITKIKEIILSDPEKRPTPATTSIALKEMYQSVNKHGYLKTLQQLNAVITTKDHLNKIKTIKTDEVVKELIEEKQLYQDIKRQ